MARKTLEITIDDDNRDKGKTFYLEEMAIDAAEYWATRVLAVIDKNNIQIPDEARSGGMAAIASIGVQMLVKADIKETYPLMDELMACVTVRPDPSHPQLVRKLASGDIEEVGTKMRLKFALLGLHLGFSNAVAPSISSPPSTPGLRPAASPSPIIRTSPRSSARSSR